MSEKSQNYKKLSDAEHFILDAIQQTRYGAVEITIHDSKVVQVARSEKTRFGQPSS